MRPSELGDWRAFWHLNPWGEERADLRQALGTSVLANAHRGAETPPFEHFDFMPFTERPERSSDADPDAVARLVKRVFKIDDPKYSAPPTEAVRLRKALKRKGRKNQA